MSTDFHRWARLLAGFVLCAAAWGLTAREAAAAPACTATMTALDFGSVDLVTGGTLAATATLRYTCTNDQTSARISRLCFNIGDGSASIAAGGGRWNPRILRDGSGNEMNVQFYQDPGSIIWGSNGQPVPDPYDIVVTMPQRVNSSTPSTTTAIATLRGQIATGQAALPAGLYQSNFNGNHTALRYTTPGTATNPADCASATVDGGAFGFLVNATVIKSCVVSADPMDFGSVEGVGSTGNIDATTTIRVICSKPTAYNVLLIPSNNNTTGAGVMKGLTSGNTDTVPYRLYSNAGRSTAWGNQAANDISGTGNGLTQPLTVYGRIAGLPNVRPDNYKDTVTVNVTY